MKYSNWKNSTYGDNDDNIYVPSKICKGVLIYIEKGDDDDEYVFVRIACLFFSVYLDSLQIWCAHYWSLVEFDRCKMPLEESFKLQIRRFSI